MRSPYAPVSDDVLSWSGIVLRTTLGTLLNPSPTWSDWTMDALVRAVDVTLWLDADSQGGGGTTSEIEDEVLLWEQAEAAMKNDFEMRPRYIPVS